MFYFFVVIFPCSIYGNEDIVHIDKYISFSQLVPEDGVHHALECGRCILHFKVHYFGLKESFIGFEGGYVSVLRSNEDVVEAFVYIY